MDDVKFQAVIKLAASAAHEAQNPGERPEAVVRQPGRRPGAPLDFGVLEAVPAADLITA